MKKIRRGGGGRAWRLGSGLVGLCLLLTATGYGAKTDPDPPKTNGSSTRKEELWGDRAKVAAMTAKFTSEEKALHERQLEKVRAFAAAKEKQAEKLAQGAGEDISPEAQRYFDAAKKGDTSVARALFGDFMKRHRQYENSKQDKTLDTSYWSTLLEVDLAYECVVPIDPKSVQMVVDDTFNTIPPGSIYFGGTDSGRGLPTAFSKSHADGDPFFTLTQNALADGSYLAYLRRMYGEKIYLPTAEDSEKCFADYYADATKRAEHDQDHPREPRQIRPGEDVQLVGGRLQISGQVAVMTINGMLVKIIFDHNPKPEFYIEESFPLDWMYPYLEPRGPIMKLNHHELTELPTETVAKDREYWRAKVKEKLGDWLTEETPVATVTRFAEKVYGRNDLSGFSGDERFLQSEFAQKMISKLRSSIAGVYDWRSQHASLSVEKERMAKEADFACRQAFVLCPYSPEATYRYVQFLVRMGRVNDAILVASTAAKITPDNSSLMSLVERLKEMKK